MTTPHATPSARVYNPMRYGYDTGKYPKPLETYTMNGKTYINAEAPNLLTIDNTSRLGYSVRVFDADGQEVTDCVEANIVTGYCVQIAKRPDGKFVTDDEDRLSYVHTTRKAPLTFHIKEATS